MNRRHLLQAMLSVPVAGALGGCRHEHSDHGHTVPPSRGGTLRVILQGPFAVVIDTKNRHRITAFVPYTDNNDHEFRYSVPIEPDNKNVFPEIGAKGKNHFQFVLDEDNLETNDRMPHIDAGFADFTLKVSGWKAEPDKYFVKLDLPAPELITYRNEPAQLGRLARDKGTDRVVVLRTSHVLQYRVRDLDDLKKVKVRSSQLGDRHPFSCADLGSVVRQQGATVGKLDPERSQRMATEFDQCSNSPVRALFFGVGLSPAEHGNTEYLANHGRDFFNSKLLEAFPDVVDKEQHRIVDANVQVCGTGTGGNSMFVAAAQRYPMQPRLVPVTSLTDCRASAVTAVNS